MPKFIYALADPLEPEHIRYVGMAGSRASRPCDHAKYARRADAKTTWQVNWIRKLQAEGREPAVLILEEFDDSISRIELSAAEKRHIATAKTAGHRLTNGTEGGEGGTTNTGRHWSEETRAKLGASLRSSPVFQAAMMRPDLIERRKTQNLGKRHSEATRAQMSASHRGKPIGVGRIATPEACANQSAAHKGKPWSEARRVAQAASIVKQVASLKTTNAKRRAANALLSPELSAQKEIMRLQKLIADLKAKEEKEKENAG